jgi:hypothetical protein
MKTSAALRCTAAAILCVSSCWATWRLASARPATTLNAVLRPVEDGLAAVAHKVDDAELAIRTGRLLTAKSQCEWLLTNIQQERIARFGGQVAVLDSLKALFEDQVRIRQVTLTFHSVHDRVLRLYENACPDWAHMDPRDPVYRRCDWE